MIRRDAADRATINALKAKIKELEKPQTEAERKARKAARRNREKAIDRKAEGQRKPRVKDQAYLNWIRSLPCACCGKPPRSEAAHIRAGYSEGGWRPTGMAEKPDDVRCASLCANCHRTGPKAQHANSERAWWSALGIHPPDLCRALRAAYDAGQPGEPVIRSFAQPGNPK